MRTAVKFVLVAAVAVVAACSGPALPSSQAIAGPVAEPDLINTPNTHWINRDQQCTTSDTPGATHGQVFQPSETAPPDPAKCPSPEPVPGAAAIALGKPLSVSKIAVPITGLGTVRVPVGQVTLPNGYYTSTAFELLNAKDGTYQLYNIHIELASTLPDRPPMTGSVATRPLRDGPETFIASLVFEVRSYQPGAKLIIGNLLVR